MQDRWPPLMEEKSRSFSTCYAKWCEDRSQCETEE